MKMFTFMCLVLIGLCLIKEIPNCIGLLAMAIAIFEKGEDNDN